MLIKYVLFYTLFLLNELCNVLICGGHDKRDNYSQDFETKPVTEGKPNYPSSCFCEWRLDVEQAGQTHPDTAGKLMSNFTSLCRVFTSIHPLCHVVAVAVFHQRIGRNEKR